MTPGASQTLDACRARGIALRLDGTNLAVRAQRGVLVPALRDDLARHKPAIMALLRIEAGLPPPCPGDIAEHIAIIANQGIPLAEVEARALGEAGFVTWSDFSDAWGEHIAQRIAAQSIPGKPLDRLAIVTLAFTKSPWLSLAVHYGWGMHELFGVSTSGGPIGLVARLAKATDRSRLTFLDQNGAVVSRPNGTTRQFHRFGPEFDAAEPWWMQPATTGQINQAEAA